ncbi:MAG TPA: hypothetical protein VJT85_02555 [Gemmatimonadaceae bacterium]|nr:hypothetical protein [Gemmatimonadaceae bacterium]
MDPSATTTPTPLAGGPWRTRALRLAVVLSAVVLLFPALTPAHVEGFSASIVSLGLYIRDGDVSRFDTLYPVSLEFFGLSRLGTTVAVSLLSRLPGVSGDMAMRVTVWVSFVVFLIASAILTRRWSSAGWTATAVALLLLPGVSESAFFFNDNVLSSALALSALALVATMPSVASAAAAGLLFGAAMLARTDALLLAPAVPLLFYETDRLQRRFFLKSAAFGVCCAVVVFGVLALFHSTFLDVVRISAYVVSLWARGWSLLRHAEQGVLFAGVPGAIFAGLGIFQVVRQRNLLTLLLLLAVPLLFNLASLGKLWQARQLLPLTPFIAALVIRGWRYAAPELTASRLPSMRAVLVAVTAFVVFGPLVNYRIDDGPRATIGRLRNLRQWPRWQRAVNSNGRELSRFAADLGAARRSVIVTDEWNSDRYFHLALQDAGFEIAPTTDLPAQCRRISEQFVRGSSRVVHVRLHTPFLRAGELLLPERASTYAKPCMIAFEPDSAFMLAPVDRLEALLERKLGPDDEFERRYESSRRSGTGWVPITATPVTAAAMDTIIGSYQRFIAVIERLHPELTARAVPLSQVDAVLAARVGFAYTRAP